MGESLLVNTLDSSCLLVVTRIQDYSLMFNVSLMQTRLLSKGELGIMLLVEGVRRPSHLLPEASCSFSGLSNINIHLFYHFEFFYFSFSLMKFPFSLLFFFSSLSFTNCEYC